jgi:hypothetical protein
MRSIDRRTVVAGIACALPAAAIGAAPALASPALAQLIERHRAAHRAFCDTLSENGENDGSPAYDAASDAEGDTLLALCSHRCETIEEASAKAAYLLTRSVLEILDYEHVTALLQSFAPPAA